MSDDPDARLGQSDAALEQLVDAVHGSPKYRHVSPTFIRAIGAGELAKRPALKEAIKATKNKLHQVGAAYIVGETRYARWLEQLTAAQRSGDRVRFQEACAQVMGHHASTRERLPILDRFYEALLSGLPPIRTVLDIACGLNPLAVTWMPFGGSLDGYYACDIYEDMIAFLNRFFELASVPGHAETCDVVRGIPPYKVDLALVLKAIPCLEQIDKSAGERLLDSLNADHILVSFPVHSLGGRDKETRWMAHYERRLAQLSGGKGWSSRRFEFTTELAFLLSR